MNLNDVLASLRDWVGMLIGQYGSELKIEIISDSSTCYRVLFESEKHLAELIVNEPTFAPYRFVSFQVMNTQVGTKLNPIYSFFDNDDCTIPEITDRLNIGIKIVSGGISQVVNSETWTEIVQAVIEDMPFQPAFIIKYLNQPCDSGQRDCFTSDVSYLGDWSGENFPPAKYYDQIEWIKVRPRYLKHRGRLVKPQLIDASCYFEKILEKHNIPYELENGTYCIYGYR